MKEIRIFSNPDILTKFISGELMDHPEVSGLYYYV